MTREQFRREVFARDNGRCVICGEPGQDAHHILERRLFPDGGYVPDNGATLCGPCHLRAEQTVISCDEIREAAGIARVVLAPHLYPDQPYDKWGNPILPDGQRMRGELFDDESVQKILAAGGVLGLFTWKVRYPRTYHLPWSESITKDDRVLTSLAALEGERVVVTEKMDGENVTMARQGIHSRSTAWRRHPAHSWVSNLHASIAHEIPDGWRVCGENLFAQHTLEYDGLPSYYLAFSVWEGLECLPWPETLEWIALLGLEPVPVLWRGRFSVEALKAVEAPGEGYVVRPERRFHLRQFPSLVAKWVRSGFAIQRPHWQLGRAVVPNTLAKT